MPVQLRFKPGAMGEYFDGAIDDPGRVVSRTVHASTCSHCAGITEFPSLKTMMEHVDICRCCMRLICLNCLGKPCLPYEKRAEHEEKMARIQGQVQMGAWRCY